MTSTPSSGRSVSASETAESRPYCGHFATFDERRFEYLFSRVAAIRAASDEDNDIGTDADPYPDIFEFTHRPITVYESESSAIGEGAEATEQDVLSELQSEHNRNFAVVIQGTVGTGKSELCSYLVHQLQDDRPILEVRKDDDLMSLLTTRIPEFYEEQFGEPFPNQTNYAALEEDLKNPSYDIPGLITRKAIRRIGNDGYALIEGTEIGAIEEFLTEQMDILLEAVEDEDRGSKFVTEQYYQQKEFLKIFADESQLDDQPWEIINQYLWDAVLDEYDTPSIEKILKQVGARFTETRPIIVFEDFSIAAVQANRIRDFIERDIAGDAWDFIIAGTTDSIRPLQTKTFQRRFSFYQTNEPGSNQVPFLSADDVVDFIRPYLAYPKAHDGSVAYSEPVDSGRLLGIHDGDPADESECAECGLCGGQLDRMLYPLTQTFIERIYSGLRENERSPREVVRVISDIIKETYYGPAPVPSSASVLEKLTNKIAPSDAVYDDAPMFVGLAKWYGHKDGDVWEVDRRIPESFGVIADDTEPGKLSAGIEVTPRAVRIPDLSVEFDDPDSDSPDGSSTDDEDGGAETGTDSDEGEEPQRTAGQRLFEQHRGEVDNWRQNPAEEELRDTDAYISNAIEDLIQHLTNDYSIWTHGDLRYNLSSEKRPFVFQNTDNNAADDQITINIRSFERSALSRLLRYGIKLEEGGANQDELLERYGTRFSRLAARWQSTIEEEFIYTDEILFDKRTGAHRGFESFVVSSYALTCLLEDPWQPLTAERLNERFADSDPHRLDSHLSEALDDGRLSEEDLQTLDEVVGIASRLESLLETQLAVSKNQLDVPAVRSHLKSGPITTLGSLARSRINEVDTRVRFSATDQDKLRTIAGLVKDATTVITDTEQQTQIDTYPQTIQERLGSVAITDIVEITQTLSESYEELVPPELLETLNRLVRFSKEDFDAVRAGAAIAGEQQYGTTEQVQQTTAYLKLRGHPLTALIETVFETSTTTGQSVAPRFQKVAEYYVE